jgi:hypothetical protein
MRRRFRRRFGLVPALFFLALCVGAAAAGIMLEQALRAAQP